MTITRLYLVRHGEQDPASGHAPEGGLSALGRTQAGLLGRRLAATPFAAIHHSPLTRAAQTASIVGEHLAGVPRHACERMADRTPVPSPERLTDYPARWHSWFEDVPVSERDEDAIELQAAVTHFGMTGAEDRNELLITHNFVIGWFVRHVLDAPDWRWLGLNQANCGLTIVQWATDRPATLLSFNDVGHL